MPAKRKVRNQDVTAVPVKNCKVLVERVDMKLFHLKPVVLLPRLEIPDNSATSNGTKKPPSIKRKLTDKMQNEPLGKKDKSLPTPAKPLPVNNVSQPNKIRPPKYAIPDVVEPTSEMSLPIVDWNDPAVSPQPTPDDDIFLNSCLSWEEEHCG